MQRRYRTGAVLIMADRTAAPGSAPLRPPFRVARRYGVLAVALRSRSDACPPGRPRPGRRRARRRRAPRPAGPAEAEHPPLRLRRAPHARRPNARQSRRRARRAGPVHGQALPPARKHAALLRAAARRGSDHLAWCETAAAGARRAAEPARSALVRRHPSPSARPRPLCGDRAESRLRGRRPSDRSSGTSTTTSAVARGRPQEPCHT